MKSPLAISLRLATDSDASELGRVHVECWRETYAGLVPNKMIAELCSVKRARVWADMLNDPGAYSDMAVYVAEEEGRMLGFGCFGMQTDNVLAGRGLDGEISSIYVLKSAQKRGLGAVLMRRMASDLRDRGCTGVGLWVLRENAPARRFYEHLGGVALAEKRVERATGNMAEIGYGWKALTSLCK